MSKLSEVRWLHKKLRKSVAKTTDESKRFIDFGLEVCVVEQDPAGVEVLYGCPKVRILRSHFFGGVFDVRFKRVAAATGTPEYAATGAQPKRWFVSPPQERILLHTDEIRSRLLVYGAMGAGKTRVLAMWLVLRAIEALPYASQRRTVIGATAPTQARRDELSAKITEICRPNWFLYSQRRSTLTFAFGVAVEFRATQARSTDTGSPIQGQTWIACASDEIQDSIDADADIEMRGRGAPFGRYMRLCTATAKDSLKWRHYRDGLSDALWSVERLEGTSNWTVWPSFWEEKKSVLSTREYRMKVLALDVSPERAVYPSWDRVRNLAPVPLIGARDVTETVLAAAGPNRAMLLGHDPGVLRNVTVFLKAYQFPRQARHVWFVVDEIETLQTTTEQHATVLLDRLQQKWSLNWPGDDEPCVLIRTDPWSERDAGTHRSVYIQMRQFGFHVLAADHTAKGEGKKQIPLRASVEMINRLLCAADGSSRLFLAQDSAGRAVAAKTLHSIELSQWDAWGAKEISQKDNKDKDPTDYTSALRYALWGYERSRHRIAGRLSEVIA